MSSTNAILAMCKTTVLRVYNIVIEDVISKVREIFTDEGVNEEILQELKTLWETKLVASEAVHVNTVASKPANKKQVTKSENVQIVQQTAENKAAEDVQITLFVQQPTVDLVPRVLTIQVPATALKNPQVHSLLTGPVITATMGLPIQVASSLLQQHVNAALQGQPAASQNLVMPQMEPSTSGQPITIEFVRSGVDGSFDTSDDDTSAKDTSDDEASDDETGEKGDHQDGATEEEPLNSEDDVTDEEPTDFIDTDNVVVCQYVKIIRSRNKWKFYLKDGIMNLEGKDFVFQKASGDAEW